MRGARRAKQSFWALRTDEGICRQMRQPPRYHTDLVLGNAVTCVHYHFSEVKFVFMTV